MQLGFSLLASSPLSLVPQQLGVRSRPRPSSSGTRRLRPSPNVVACTVALAFVQSPVAARLLRPCTLDSLLVSVLPRVLKRSTHRRVVRILINGCGEVDLIQKRLYCAQLVLALDELHKRRIIHRDIKPGNILVTRDHEVVLADLGYARAFGRTSAEQVWRQLEYLDNPVSAEDPRDGETGQPLDYSRRLLGTLPYMAPEVYCRVGYSYAADIFSLGVTFYEMLHGKLPFGIAYENRNFQDVCRKIVCSPLDVNEDIDADARDLLHRMLHKDDTLRATLEEIKEHPWFASINFDELSHRERPRPLTPMKGLEPTREARGVEFCAPYLEGEAPHPWYQWVSPLLQNRNPKAKSWRKKKALTHQRSVSAPSARPAPRASPVPPMLSAFFASPPIPAFFASPPIPASPVSPAFPALPPRSTSAAPALPAPPAAAPAPASSLLSAERLSFAPPQARPPPPSLCALTRPRGLDVVRPVPVGRGVHSVRPDTSLVEDTRHALELAAAAGDAANRTRATAVAAPAVHSNALYTVNLDAPSRDVTRVTDAPPSWEAFKRPIAADRLVVKNENVYAGPSSRSTKTDATDVTRVDAHSMLSSKLAPRARERSPWAFA
ncbi:kinase-like protein [Trametes sanguinea]|nr:kinase-like protein [Trametes sanguinea]